MSNSRITLVTGDEALQDIPIPQPGTLVSETVYRMIAAINELTRRERARTPAVIRYSDSE